MKRDQEDIDQVLSFLKPRMPFQEERKGLVNIVSGVEAAEGMFQFYLALSITLIQL